MILNIILIFLCPVCYFPIILSLWKSSNLRSEEHIYLHNYMFWQSVLVLFFKFVSFPYISYVETSTVKYVHLKKINLEKHNWKPFFRATSKESVGSFFREIFNDIKKLLGKLFLNFFRFFKTTKEACRLERLLLRVILAQGPC